MSPYRVVIRYREPTYELRAGPKARDYSATYAVWAASVEEARAQALREFQDTAARSQVGWVRQIVRIAVEVRSTPLAGPDAIVLV